MTYANPHAMSDHTNASLTSARGTVIGKAAHLRGLAVGCFKRVRWALPEGQTLPLDAWRPRHEVMLWLVWLHALGGFVFGLVVGAGPVHSVVEGSLVALWAVAANTTVFSRRTRSAAASLGLLTA